MRRVFYNVTHVKIKQDCHVTLYDIVAVEECIKYWRGDYDDVSGTGLSAAVQVGGALARVEAKYTTF